ncbi:hypothetical protein PMAYCL1PPCAC_23016, partial [Pristionchus mayeri]
LEWELHSISLLFSSLDALHSSVLVDPTAVGAHAGEHRGGIAALCSVGGDSVLVPRAGRVLLHEGTSQVVVASGLLRGAYAQLRVPDGVLVVVGAHAEGVDVELRLLQLLSGVAQLVV